LRMNFSLQTHLKSSVVGETSGKRS
jgi:hypothetical protein